MPAGLAQRTGEPVRLSERHYRGHGLRKMAQPFPRQGFAGAIPSGRKTPSGPWRPEASCRRLKPSGVAQCSLNNETERIVSVKRRDASATSAGSGGSTLLRARNQAFALGLLAGQLADAAAGLGLLAGAA